MKLFILLGMALSFLGCPQEMAPDQETVNQLEKEAEAQAPLLVAGKIHLDPKIHSNIDPLSVLFIIARDPKNSIVAVKKLFPPFNYPLEFKLTQADQMIGDRPLPAQIKLKVRIDQDANANPDQPGDAIGKSELTQVGQIDVELTIDEIVK